MAQMCRLLKHLEKAFPLTGRSLLSSQPPRTSSEWCCAGSAGTAGLPLPSCTAASDAHSHDLFLSLVWFTWMGKRAPYQGTREASVRWTSYKVCGYVITREEKYHQKCMVVLQSRARFKHFPLAVTKSSALLFFCWCFPKPTWAKSFYSAHARSITALGVL